MLDGLKYEFINGHLPVAVVKKEIDRNENDGTVNAGVGPKGLPADRQKGCEKTVSDSRVEFSQARTVPCEILGEAARSVRHA